MDEKNEKMDKYFIFKRSPEHHRHTLLSNSCTINLNIWQGIELNLKA